MAGEREGQPGLEYEVDAGVAVLTVSNRSARNALTLAMVEQLHELCRHIEDDHDLGAVVIRGAGGHFCAGLDRGVIETQSVDPAGSNAFARASDVYGSFIRIGRLPVPTIAAVRGVAVGAGLNLAMATDLRIVSLDARLFAGFDRIGVHPGGGFFSLATRVAGRETAAALGIAGEELSGQRAAEVGMAWRSVEDSQVEQIALGLARRIAVDPDLARANVASFRTEAGPPILPWDAAVEVERGRQAWTFRRLEEDRSERERAP